MNVLPKEKTGVNIKYAVDRLKTTNSDIYCKHIPKVLHILLDSYYQLYLEYSKHNSNLYSVNQKVGFLQLVHSFDIVKNKN